jgi:hypothetical protein
MRLRLGIVVGVFGLLLAAPAGAAVRYAEPNGNGPEASCPKKNPCAITDAIEGPSVGEGDQIVVLPGTYSLDESLIGPGGIDVGGAVGKPRPVIRSSTAGSTLFVSSGTMHDLSLINTGGGRAINGTPSGSFQRVFAQTNGDFACQLPFGTLGGVEYARDSVCVNSGSGAGAGLAISGSGTLDFQLRNLTAVATGALGRGIAFQATGSISMNVDAFNVIAQGDTEDVFGSEDTGEVDIDLDFSNYDTIGQFGGASITPEGSLSNLTDPPLFANEDALDFHQLAGSPTRDAGGEPPDVDLLGSLDFERQPRIQGDGIDIGADEFDNRLRLKAKAKKKQKAKKLKVKVSCPEEECYVKAKGRAEAGGEKFKLKKTKERFLEAGEKAKLKLKPNNLDELKSLLAGGDGKAKIKVKGTDAGGVKAKKRVKVKLVG